jgi:hypothetical protein
MPNSACHTRLEHTLRAHAALQCATLLRSSIQPWASATFVGARHSFAFGLKHGVNVHALQAQLNDLEFDLPHYIVADVALTTSGQAVIVEALMVEAD